MGVSGKGRRTITVSGQEYFWYIKADDESAYFLLHIVSPDKALILTCPLNTKTPYVISKGNIFQKQQTNGIWNRYLLPFPVPDIITPKFVSALIIWATQCENAAGIKWNGTDVPV